MKHKRWYMTEATWRRFSRFRKELELRLNRDLSQDEFVRVLCDHKDVVLDVLLNTASADCASRGGTEE